MRPERLADRAYQPRAVVTGVEIGHQAVPPLRFNDSPAPPLLVPPEARGFAVAFAAADYASPERLHYAYRLVGFDPDWIAADAGDRRAEYTNLPPGEYTLALRGTSREGVWGPAREIAVRVLPAWHQRLPVRLAFGAGLLGLVAGLVQLRTALLRAQQRELERQVRARTEDLERLAMVDPLTGIANRRNFMLRAEVELAEARRQGTPLGLLAFDLDRFKALNDRYGHAGGDAALRHVAALIDRHVAKGDLAARIGGEEFVVLAPRTTPAELAAMAERLRGLIAATPALCGEERIALTTSIGAAALTEADTTIDSVLARADEALYRAKREGRNRLAVA